MNCLPERRRPSLTLRSMSTCHRADPHAFAQLRSRCSDVGVKITGLREVLLHGIIRLGDGATANDVWGMIGEMTRGKGAVSRGSIQRNLNLLTDYGILVRSIGSDRIWRYSKARVSDALSRTDVSVVTFIETGSGWKSLRDVAEAKPFLHRLSNDYGTGV